MAEIIELKTVEDVKAAYEKLGVKQTRIDSLNEKFSQLPKEFECMELGTTTLTIGDKTLENVPCFFINKEKTKYVLIGTFKQMYTDKTTASKITKNTVNNGKFLVVNNKNVHPIAEGLSEAELVLALNGKKFKTAPAKDYPVYQPEYKDEKPIYQDTAELALAKISPKSYQKIVEI